ncbi:beta-galactosidase GalB [Pedobacter sp. Du54]|uniref:beta-galactosidase GalB n=1 Tax=Pedobacter anseongensis TaxID=3133439 RepID=UPI003099C27A
MNKLKTIFIIFLASLSFVQAQIRKDILLENGWKFSKGDFPAASQMAFDDKAWKMVSVPHDWAIYGPFDENNDIQIVKITQNNETKETRKTGRTGALPYMGIGWYRTKFTIPASLSDEQVSLLFDGVMSNSTIFVNGKEVGRWPYGYSSFHFDISSLLLKGKANTLSVRVDNKPESSRWYPGAGIYRNVHLLIQPKTNLKTWGTFITTPEIEAGLAKVNVKTKLSDSLAKGFKLTYSIIDSKGITLASRSVLGKNEIDLSLKNPKLWSPEQPTLYTLVTKLYLNNVLTDQQQTRFGVRKAEFKRETGFWLNEKNVKFKGVCLHHDLGPLGAAVNTAAIRRQLVLLKDLGCNAIRTSHNPVAPEFLDLCDEMGFLVIEETFDEWKRWKMKNGYHNYFDQWAEKDVTNMIERDRNHPSIIMWSIGNEVPDQDNKEGYKLVQFLQDICHKVDPTRLVTAGMDRINSALKNNFAATLDVPGFNYKPKQYFEAYKKLPQGFLYGSETASTVSSRGIYQFPVVLGKDKHYPDLQSSSYDLEYCNWSQVPDDEWAVQDTTAYSAGEFVWTGFDYLGEPTPYDDYWPSRSSYFGIYDLAGLPKDRFYLYKSRWKPEEPTLHLLPHWNWEGKEGMVIPVFCYTNYPSAELFVNGKSMGVQKKSNLSNLNRYRLMWKDVVYEKGSIKVVAYNKAGKAVATEEVKTAGAPHHLKLSADRTQLKADGKDLSFVTISVVDKEGNLCPNATDNLSFSVSGAGKYRAACNGDATSLQLFHEPEMKAFSGMAVVIVETTKAKGLINLKVMAKGLPVGLITLNAK